MLSGAAPSCFAGSFACVGCQLVMKRQALAQRTEEPRFPFALASRRDLGAAPCAASPLV